MSRQMGLGWCAGLSSESGTGRREDWLGRNDMCLGNMFRWGVRVDSRRTKRSRYRVCCCGLRFDLVMLSYGFTKYFKVIK